MQYPVIYSRLNRRNRFSHYSASLAYTQRRKKKERGQKINDLPVLATCHSDTLAILSSEVNGPAVHGSTQGQPYNGVQWNPA